MAVFLKFDGEIYGSPDRESVIREMRGEFGSEHLNEDEIVELPADTKIAVVDEDEDVVAGEFVTLAEEFGDSPIAGHVATCNA